jgi:hypothetical protein
MAWFPAAGNSRAAVLRRLSSGGIPVGLCLMPSRRPESRDSLAPCLTGHLAELFIFCIEILDGEPPFWTFFKTYAIGGRCINWDII